MSVRHLLQTAGIVAWSLLVLVFSQSVFSAQNDKLVFLLTGETHAALYPCDCPEKPEGGISGRATLISRIRKSYPNLLLLDGGGSFAGGIYDVNTAGDSLNKIKSSLYAKAMAAMGYDALAVGDEELHYGLEFLKNTAGHTGLTFLSANLKAGAEPIRPYKIVERSGLRIGLIGLTTSEQMSPVRAEAATGNPFKAVREMMLKQMGKVDFTVVLSHLGEDLSLALADSFPQINMIVNGHRKKSVSPIRKRGQTWIVNFSYLGKELYEVHLSKKDRNKKTFKRHSVSPDIEQDSVMTGILREWDAVAKSKPVQLDLYVMAHCPYGVEAEAWMLPLVDSLGLSSALTLHFIISKKNGTYTSLHGEEELKENMRQSIIQNRYPGKLFAYVNCVNQSPDQWAKCLEELKLNPRKISSLIGSKRETLLQGMHHRSARLNVNSSPTLYVNNTLYTGPIEQYQLLKYLCTLMEANAKPCVGLPACLLDEDCRAPGKEGKCFNPGESESRCVFRDAVPFELIVIADTAAPIASNIEEVIRHTIEVLPGAKRNDLGLDNQRAKALLSKHNAKSVPSIFLEKTAVKSAGFERVSDAVVDVGEYFMIEQRTIRNPVLFSRRRMAGRIALFWSPLSSQANEILERLFSIADEKKSDLTKLAFHPILVTDTGSIKAPNGRPEMEEIQRQLALPRKKVLPYLKERAANWNSSYWEEPLERIGLNPGKIKKKSKSRKAAKMIKEAAERYKAINEPDSPLFFLIENRQVAKVRNEEELAEILDLIP